MKAQLHKFEGRLLEAKKAVLAVFHQSTTPGEETPNS